jgi:hypothetical protein
MAENSKETKPGADAVDYSRPLSAILAEELSAAANRSSSEVVKAVDEVLPEFELLKDCVVRLLKARTLLLEA